jgi:hypothetical protein
MRPDSQHRIGPEEDDALIQLVQQLAKVVIRNEERAAKKDLAVTDNRLKVEQKLKKITATSSDTLMEELDEFENTMQHNFIKDWRSWYKYFETALEQNAKDWIDGTHLRQLGLGVYQEAMKEGSQDFVWAVVCRLARSELMRKIGIAHEIRPMQLNRIGMLLFSARIHHTMSSLRRWRS